MPAGIYGQVTYQGDPISDIGVDLYRCFNMGNYWACPSTYAQYTTTLMDGSYQFPAAFSIGVGQKYHVSWYNGYHNSVNPNYLHVWWGPDIVTYTAGQIVPGGNFDIANTFLLSPTDAVTVGLPIVFSWTQRTATPSDNYRVALLRITDGAYWESPSLGYVGSFTLTSLPSGFTTGATYQWMLKVDNADGYGFSQESRTFTISNGSQR